MRTIFEIVQYSCRCFLRDDTKKKGNRSTKQSSWTWRVAKRSCLCLLCNQPLRTWYTVLYLSKDRYGHTLHDFLAASSKETFSWNASKLHQRISLFSKLHSVFKLAETSLCNRPRNSDGIVGNGLGPHPLAAVSGGCHKSDRHLLCLRRWFLVVWGYF